MTSTWLTNFWLSNFRLSNFLRDVLTRLQVVSDKWSSRMLTTWTIPVPRERNPLTPRSGMVTQTLEPTVHNAPSLTNLLCWTLLCSHILLCILSRDLSPLFVLASLPSSRLHRCVLASSKDEASMQCRERCPSIGTLGCVPTTTFVTLYPTVLLIGYVTPGQLNIL